MFRTLTGNLIEIVPCIYTKSHIITFELFNEKFTNKKYLIVSKTEESEPHSSYCFDYNNIPNNINKIYLHAKKYSNTLYYKDDATDIIITGTSLYTSTEHNYIIGKYSINNYPINKEFNFTYNDEIDLENCNILYKYIADKMTNVKSISSL